MNITAIYLLLVKVHIAWEVYHDVTHAQNRCKINDISIYLLHVCVFVFLFDLVKRSTWVDFSIFNVID